MICARVALHLNRFFRTFGAAADAPGQVKPDAVRHLPDRDGRVHDALFFDLLEQSQDPCYLTNATFCSVFPAPKVRQNI